MRDRLPLILSITALLVAVLGITPFGEAAYNAVVPKNSVGTPQLQRNAVKAAKIAPNAVRTGHVLDGSLLTADFKAGQIPKGPQGDKGDKGDAGATNLVVRTQRPCPNGLPTNVHCVMIPRCEAGERAVSGGGGFTGNLGDEELQQSYPLEADGTMAEDGDTPVGWVSIIENKANTVQIPIGYVVCASP